MRWVSSTQRVGRIKGLASTGPGLRWMLNLWPPLLFAGIHVQEVSRDFRHARVRLRRTPFTTNYVGTQFGGSLFAMTDPIWMLLVMRNLGPGYVVWDKAAEIEFIRPARTAVTARFDLTDEVLAELRVEADGGTRVLRWFTTDITSDDGTLVARARKQLHIRQAR